MKFTLSFNQKKMKSLKIDVSDSRSAQDRFHKHFSSSVEAFDYGNKIILEGTEGNGEIYFLRFNDGISMDLYECAFDEVLNLEVDNTRSALIYMFYPLSDGVRLGLDESGTMKSLSKYQPVLVSSVPGKAILLSLSKNRQIKLLVLKVDRKKYAANRIKLFRNRAVLDTIFADRDPVTTIIHVCSPNLYIADLVQRLSHHTLREAYGIFVLEAETNLILGHILAQYVTDVNSAGGSRTLTKQELEKVRELAITIARKPDEPYTIKQLTSITGLTPSKLQEGFKHLYRRTASDFIRDKRLTRAAELLGTNDHNVTEVVGRIGLNSNSYFAKIFKDKYSCSPKEYQNQVKKHEIFEVDLWSKPQHSNKKDCPKTKYDTAQARGG